MSLEFYKIVHLSGLMLLFLGLGGVLISSYSGGNLKGHAKALAFACHGLGLMFLLVGGFGMMARLGMVTEMPKWVYVKLAIWVYMAIAISIAKRKAQRAWPLAISFVLVASAAAYLAINKPF